MDSRFEALKEEVGASSWAEVAEAVEIDRATLRNLYTGRTRFPKKEVVEKLRKTSPTIFGSMEYVHPSSAIPQKRCGVHRCHKYAVSKGMCDSHYREVLHHGRVRSPAEKRAPGGAGHLDRFGYVRMKHPVTGCQTFQHRLVMEEALGRQLLPEENVHHKNGNRSDNRLENLEVWVKSQPAGQRVPDLVEWAKKILSTYSPESLTNPLTN